MPLETDLAQARIFVGPSLTHFDMNKQMDPAAIDLFKFFAR